ncbi:YczE/YyaS/YitT family protein [Carnobacterium sp. CS13]|uniref:YczE/YyaS/YitT family protein n=1 Tax=Carnobacterium sp. CS13 TaxID=2800128 RepID=UPI001F2A8515|nr:DUF6198 family protein [Carnobacterium sp. CS13]
MVKRYSMFFLSLFIMGLGIGLVTSSNLGTSSISSIPYVLSMIYPLSFGMFTFITNILFVISQKVILKEKFPKRQYMQLVVGPFFGLFIDLGMFLFVSIHPTTYLEQLSILLLGCTILAFGIFVQLAANVITNPGEGFVNAISIKWNKEFSNVKVISDLVLVLIAVLFSFIAFGTIRGIREGTILSVIVVGPMIKLFKRIFSYPKFQNLKSEK